MTTDDEPREASSASVGPVGQGARVVADGDSIESIAFELGFFHETLWNHPANAELNAVRRNPNVLLPGDRVTIPPLTLKEEACATGKRHVFRRRGVPAVYRVQLLEEGAPRPNVAYVLEIDGAARRGTSDADGRIVHRIPPDARRGRLILGDDEIYELEFGRLRPVERVEGVQQRLKNLGFDCGAVDGELGPATRRALARFQEHRGLPASGDPDEATRAALIASHGS
ncbi:peptidoglycan-binding protein [Sorangium sp. So ce542]|uniref:peptidoglycan-binding protein n=1 Tax=Sorangium sp. So ce542 TaxID=3133316 RepID=UPI003F61A7C0